MARIGAPAYLRLILSETAEPSPVAGVSPWDAVMGCELSIKILTAAWDLPIASTDKLVLLSLADHANDEGRCWPNIQTLATKTGLSDRSVRKAISRLKAAGHVEVIHRHRHSNIFTLNLDPSCRHVVQPTLHVVPPRPAPSAARTVKDPSINLRGIAKSDSPETRHREAEVIRRPDPRRIEELEIEARARDMCFRVKMGTETYAEYLAAMKRYEEGASARSVSYLLEEAKRRRPCPP